MNRRKSARLARDDWLKSALKICEKGIDRVKVAPLAKELGVTTGSFYWHFRNRRELLDALLTYWEREMTDKAIEAARRFPGTPAERIFFIMETVMTHSLARYDLPIWQWAQSDKAANRVFRRVLKKRFSFAAWMFEQAGFSAEQAKVRGRLMVVYMMGESTLVGGSAGKRKALLRAKHNVLLAPER